MTVLDNVKLETLAQLLARGEPEGKACVSAGFSESNVNRLFDKHPEIRERRDELVRRAAHRAELKVTDIQEMLMKDRALAHSLGQPSAAIRAAELLGKQLGMFSERKEIRVGVLEEMPFELLDQLTEAVESEATRRVTDESKGSEGASED